MAWRRIDDKPLFEPKGTQFRDAYMSHPGLSELMTWTNDDQENMKK